MSRVGQQGITAGEARARAGTAVRVVCGPRAGAWAHASDARGVGAWLSLALGICPAPLHRDLSDPTHQSMDADGNDMVELKEFVTFFANIETISPSAMAGEQVWSTTSLAEPGPEPGLDPDPDPWL